MRSEEDDDDPERQIPQFGDVWQTMAPRSNHKVMRLGVTADSCLCERTTSLCTVWTQQPNGRQTIRSKFVISQQMFRGRFWNGEWLREAQRPLIWMSMPHRQLMMNSADGDDFLHRTFRVQNLRAFHRTSPAISNRCSCWPYWFVKECQSYVFI